MGGVARRPLPVRLPVELRRSQEAHVRLGHEEHQQPQRQHPQEVLPRSSGHLKRTFLNNLLLVISLTATFLIVSRFSSLVLFT